MLAEDIANGEQLHKPISHHESFIFEYFLFYFEAVVICKELQRRNMDIGSIGLVRITKRADVHRHGFSLYSIIHYTLIFDWNLFEEICDYAMT